MECYCLSHQNTCNIQYNSGVDFTTSINDNFIEPTELYVGMIYILYNLNIISIFNSIVSHYINSIRMYYSYGYAYNTFHIRFSSARCDILPCSCFYRNLVRIKILLFINNDIYNI